MNNFILNNRNLLSKSNYIRKADPKTNYWLDFSLTKIEEYIKKYGEDFHIIVFGSEADEGDFFVIPYTVIKHILVDKHLSNSKDGRKRWIGNIQSNQLKITNCDLLVDIADYYGNPILIGYSSETHSISKKVNQLSDEEKNEYAIQNRKIEIEARQKQSIFRRKVLSNFNSKCCLTGISEKELLVASHIVPWSKRIDSRLDPSNGLCLSILYDKLFDKGFITLNNTLNVMITSKCNSLSLELSTILFSINNIKVREPVNFEINNQYLEYHRNNIFIDSKDSKYNV